MSNYGTLLLSKVLETNDVQALARHNIGGDHFKLEADRKAYEFIRDYAEQNRGQAPSYAAVTEQVPEFFYIPEVSDSYGYLTRRLLNDAGAYELVSFINSGEIQTLFNEHQNNIPELIDKLTEKFDNIKYRTDVREKVGTDIKRDTSKFIEEYDSRKEGKSFKTWKSKFTNIGEYTSGNMYVGYGKSGRGKSVIFSVVEAVHLASQGANVLIWSMEMPWFEVLVRIYVEISGQKGVTSVNVGGLDLNGGFDANDLRHGKMAEEFEGEFKSFLDRINAEIPGNIIVRGVDDYDFNNRSLRQLEADILQTKADVVIVDPFYYLDYEKNTSKTAGGDAAETSKKLRRLTGTQKVVTIAITQADETKTARDDEGERELELPNREDVKKTKALLEDASMLIAIDTDYKQGRGLVGINKGRHGGEGEVVEILYIPQVGIVREIETGEDSVAQFDF